MSKLDRLFLNCEKSLSAQERAEENNLNLKLMNEEDRTQWQPGEWDALMITIDRSCTVLEDCERIHKANLRLRDEAIKDLSNKKKYQLILSLISVDLPF